MPELPSPVIETDRDTRTARWAWLLSAIGLAFGVFLLLKLPPENKPFAAAVTGIALVWPLMRGGLWGLRALREAPLAPWQGTYYEFDGQQIRILLDDEDGRLWLCAADVFSVFGLSGHARDARRVRLLVGRDGLVVAPGSSLLCFTERGLRVWLERRTERHAGQFLLWLDKQVVAPFLKRRELNGLPPRNDPFAPPPAG